MRHFPRFVLVDECRTPDALFHELECALTSSSSVTLPDDVAHHAGRALRLKDATEVAVTTGNGKSFVGTIHFSKKEASFKPMRREEPDQPGLSLHLVQALVSTEKLDWIVEKAVELGASRLTLVPMSRSVIKLDGERLAKRLQKLNAIATSAMAQSGTNTMLTIEAMTLKEASTLSADLKLMMSPPKAGDVALNPKDHQPQTLAFAIGPEGGFDPEEEGLLKKAGWIPMTLGTRVLRTETAGLAGLVWAQTQWGGF